MQRVEQRELLYHVEGAGSRTKGLLLQSERCRQKNKGSCSNIVYGADNGTKGAALSVWTADNETKEASLTVRTMQTVPTYLWQCRAIDNAFGKNSPTKSQAARNQEHAATNHTVLLHSLAPNVNQTCSQGELDSSVYNAKKASHREVKPFDGQEGTEVNSGPVVSSVCDSNASAVRARKTSY